MLATERDIAKNAGEGGHPATLGAAEYLSLAAAPTFAIMALVTAATSGGPADLLCSVAHASPLGGMAAMYLLMSAFHMAPWLKLIARAASSRDIATS